MRLGMEEDIPLYIPHRSLLPKIVESNLRALSSSRQDIYEKEGCRLHEISRDSYVCDRISHAQHVFSLGTSFDGILVTFGRG